MGNMSENNVKKVLFVSSNSTMNSGASHSLIALIDLLKSTYSDIQVDVVLPMWGDIENELKLHKIHYVVVPYSNSLWVRNIGGKVSNIKAAARKAVNWLANKRMQIIISKYDIVHINALTTNMGAELACKKGKKLIWHFREFLEEDLGKEFVNQENAWKLINCADMRIAISQSVADKYRKTLKNSVRVIYNGVDSSKYYCEHQILMGDFARISLPGRLSRFKGQMVLLEALNLMIQEGYTNISALIVGGVDDGDYAASLKLYADEHKIPVEFESYTDEVKTIYKTSDIICVCSQNEAFGRVVVEAMMAGCLVIGANLGGIAEIIKDGITGLLFETGNAKDLADKLKTALERRSMAQEIAANGQKCASTVFTAENNAHSIYLCYRQLIENSNRQ